MTNYLPKKPLVSQKQVDQAIVNFLLRGYKSDPKSEPFRIYLNGGTNIYIRFWGRYFSGYLQYRKKIITSGITTARRLRPLRGLVIHFRQII